MKRLSYVLLCSAVLAFASASSAENPAGEPEAETLAVAAEGFDVLVPVPDGWIRIDDLEAETPVSQGYRRLAVLAPKGVTQRTKMGIPSTVELVQRSDRDVKGNPLPTSNGEASESHGKTDAMIRAFVAFVGTVLGLLLLLKFRKMILWKYSRFDDFNWDGQSDFPKTNLKPGRGSK